MKLHDVYADEMKNHPYGYALYHPELASSLRPGVCGYFNALGDRTPIIDLSDSEALKAAGFTALGEGLQKAAPRPPEEWGPKCSVRVKHTQVDTAVGASSSAAGFPADAQVFYEFSSSSSYGAILMTTPPITRDAYLHESHFRQWCRDNAQTLLLKRQEVKDYDVWIVTATYAARKCSLNASLSQEKSVKVGFAAGAVGMGELAPSGTWYRASADEGWNHYGTNAKRAAHGNTEHTREGKKKKRRQNQDQSDDREEASHELKSQDPVVVFLSGLKFQYSKAQPFACEPDALRETKPSSTCWQSFVERLLAPFFVILWYLLCIITLGIPLIYIRLRRARSRNRPLAPHGASLTEDHARLELNSMIPSILELSDDTENQMHSHIDAAIKHDTPYVQLPNGMGFISGGSSGGFSGGFSGELSRADVDDGGASHRSGGEALVHHDTFSFTTPHSEVYTVAIHPVGLDHEAGNANLS